MPWPQKSIFLDNDNKEIKSLHVCCSRLLCGKISALSLITDDIIYDPSAKDSNTKAKRENKQTP